MKKYTLMFLLFLSTSSGVLPDTVGASTAEAVDGSAPLADAGLDQTVSKRATVLLDATGSRDPDGRIVSYRWRIEAPDGRTTEPVCPDCSRTRFVPLEVGRYDVTAIVTDDDGRTSRDTLYVTVRPGAPPTVRLDGPRRVTVGETGTYSARVEAGAANLSRIVWSIDGDRTARRTVGGTTDETALDHAFDSPGERVVRATVYDADGQHASASLRVTVDSDREPAIAAGRSPTVSGPRTVTGHAPLTGRYRLVADGSTAAIETVRWQSEEGALGRGDRTEVNWAPGDHHVSATVTYTDGSRNVARFPDGSTAVVADPAPTVEFDSLDRGTDLGGLATASDGYGNLDRLAVRLDGQLLEGRRVSAGRWRPGQSGALDLRFATTAFDPGEPHTLTATATDARGQTATTNRTFGATNRPAILSAEFVNGPVDSYHERIDPSRYAAHHVAKVDVNGERPEDVTVQTFTKDGNVVPLEDADFARERNYDPATDVVTVRTFWAGKAPDEYTVMTEVHSANRSSEIRKLEQEPAIFEVTSSKPEIRLDIVDDGTTGNVGSWGITVDATESFDPDGSGVKFLWKQGAEALRNEVGVAKFDSLEQASLVVEDGSGATASQTFDFHGYFSPQIAEVTPVDEGPYEPDETVRFRVRTEWYKFSKLTYDISLGLDVAGVSGRVERWQSEEYDPNRMERVRDPDVDPYRSKRFTGVVEVDASQLADAESPHIRLFNERRPDRTERLSNLPAVTVLEDAGRHLTTIEIDDLRYTIRRPDIKRVRTEYRSAKEDYEKQGYSVERTTSRGTEYTLERYERVQPAKYETRTQRFGSARYQRLFLASNDGWTPAGTVTERERYTTVDREWADSRSGRGWFTGRTRRVQTSPPRYRTLRQYRHEYRVTRVARIPVQRCPRGNFCYTTTRRYTYQVTRTDTYWARRSRNFGDQFTGRTRRTKVRDARYETQYLMAHREPRTRTNRYYRVEKRVKVRDAKYDWVPFETTKDEAYAKSLDRFEEDVRIGETSPTTEWVLTKRDGTETVVRSSYDDPSRVERTRATVRGTLIEAFRNPDTGREYLDLLGEIERQYDERGATTRAELITWARSLNTEEREGCHATSGVARLCE